VRAGVVSNGRRHHTRRHLTFNGTSVLSAAVLHRRQAVSHSTLFSLEAIEVLPSGKTPEEFHRAMHERV
jgi:hypothetical protein